MLHTKKDFGQLTSPHQALNFLIEGNKRFVKNESISYKFSQQIKQTAEKQYPFAAILSCMDSRTSVELIFNQGLGDVFSVRLAGGVISDEVLGSLELACTIKKVPLIVVLGHTDCAAFTNRFITPIGHVNSIFDKTETTFKEAQSIRKIVQRNKQTAYNHIHRSIDEILTQSPIIKNLVSKGECAIAAGIYDVNTGIVSFLCNPIILKNNNTVVSRNTNLGRLVYTRVSSGVNANSFFTASIKTVNFNPENNTSKRCCNIF